MHHVWQREEIHMKYFVRKPEDKRPLWKPRSRWDANIKINIVQ